MTEGRIRSASSESINALRGPGIRGLTPPVSTTLGCARSGRRFAVSSMHIDGTLRIDFDGLAWPMLGFPGVVIRTGIEFVAEKSGIQCHRIENRKRKT